jgi:hypothetical protein
MGGVHECRDGRLAIFPGPHRLIDGRFNNSLKFYRYLTESANSPGQRPMQMQNLCEPPPSPLRRIASRLFSRPVWPPVASGILFATLIVTGAA